MRLAIPVWNNNVSPVLDTAEKIKVFDIENDAAVLSNEVFFNRHGEDKADCIAREADVLICGALSRPLEERLVTLGVMLHPWVMGDIACIIETYVNGRIADREFSMPGCRRNRHGKHGARSRCGKLRRHGSV